MKKNQNKAIEKRLASAVEQMVPEDMYERISQSIVNDERTMNMTTTMTATPTKRHNSRWLGIAAACILLICGVFGGMYYTNNLAVDSIVDIDVNPGIEITTNKKHVVLEVTAVNNDAEKVLDGMNLKNTDLKVAVNAIIGSMVQQGYLIDGENSILVTVQNDDTQRAEYVRNLILSDLDTSLKENNITASVVNQTVTASTDASSFAQEQGISFGKAVLILNLCAKDTTLDSAALAQMSLREIAALVAEKQIDIRDIVDYDADDSVWENIDDAVEDANEDNDANHSGTAVSAEEAKAIALSHAGILTANAVMIRAELDTDDGRNVYEIGFTSNGMEYDYEVDANTGTVLSSGKENEDRTAAHPQTSSTNEATPSTSTTDAITLDRAKEIALSHAGVSAANAVYEKAALDMDDGIQVYDIAFTADFIEYDYEINAATGEICSSSKEQTDDKSQKPVAGGTSTNTRQETGVTAAGAKEIALNHAGVSASAATFIKVELDTDNGVQVFEIEFCVGAMEYDYEISAADGTVLHHEVELDD